MGEDKGNSIGPEKVDRRSHIAGRKRNKSR